MRGPQNKILRTFVDCCLLGLIISLSFGSGGMRVNIVQQPGRAAAVGPGRESVGRAKYKSRCYDWTKQTSNNWIVPGRPTTTTTTTDDFNHHCELQPCAFKPTTPIPARRIILPATIIKAPPHWARNQHSMVRRQGEYPGRVLAARQHEYSHGLLGAGRRSDSVRYWPTGGKTRDN